MPPTRAVIICNAVKRYDTLVSKATQYGAKLLKKTDQIPAVYGPPFPQRIIVTTFAATAVPICSGMRSAVFRTGRGPWTALDDQERLPKTCFKVRAQAVSPTLVSTCKSWSDTCTFRTVPTVKICNIACSYFYQEGVPGMEAKIINDLLERIQGFMASAEGVSEEGAANIAHLRNIMAFIKQSQASSEPDVVELFRQLAV